MLAGEFSLPHSMAQIGYAWCACGLGYETDAPTMILLLVFSFRPAIISVWLLCATRLHFWMWCANIISYLSLIWVSSSFSPVAPPPYVVLLLLFYCSVGVSFCMCQRIHLPSVFTYGWDERLHLILSSSTKKFLLHYVLCNACVAIFFVTIFSAKVYKWNDFLSVWMRWSGILLPILQQNIHAKCWWGDRFVSSSYIYI